MASSAVNCKKRPIPAWLLALGYQRLPEKIVVAGKPYRLKKVFKHDFFAASGLYNGTDGAVVLKIYRRQDLLGLPMKWLGRWMARREMAFYRLLEDLPEVPSLVDAFGRNGLVHQYIPGKDLLEHSGSELKDDFFDRLISLLQNLHRRGMAYIDTNKRDNIIVGDDGKPYLIDFQISWRPKVRVKNGLLGQALSTMQRVDYYHIYKHKSRLRPDLMKPAEWELRRNPVLFLKIHRLIAVPFRDFRRTTLRRLDI